MPGGSILDQIKQLAGPILASPQGQAMAQAIMSQLGGGGSGDPRAQMAQNPMGPPTGQDEGNPAVNMRGGSAMGRGPATDGELEGMNDTRNQMRPDMPYQQGMDEGGSGGLNSDGPTPDEIKLLMSNPSPRNQANFDKLFGPGAAQQVLQGGGGQPQTSYEDDVRGAMNDAKKAKSKPSDNDGDE
jgi:hypothetical protein